MCVQVQPNDHLADILIVQRETGSLSRKLLHHLLQEVFQQRQGIVFI